MTHRPPTVGIVGAGQLARMMAQAAIPLDIRIVLLAADAGDGAAQVVPDLLVGSPDDPHAVRALAERCDVITFDHELVDPEVLAALESEGNVVAPSSACMALAQNKRRQRRELGEAGFPVPAFTDVDGLEQALDFAASHGWPIVLKASRGGYDGRGVWVARSPSDVEAIWHDATDGGLVLLAEELLPLDLELAVLVARSDSGEIVVYPPVETVQRDGICVELRVPARVDESLSLRATSMAKEIADRIGIVGIMAVEFFVSRGEILVNELAPRPHNSGHWSIEGAATSQFEQHLRAVLDWPLGSTALTAPAVTTLNLLGEGEVADPRARVPDALRASGAHVHFYGKAARPGRKIGHVTAVGNDLESTHASALAASDALFGRAGASQGETE